MKFNLLINQLDEHNEVGLLLAQKYKVKSVVMLYKNKEKNYTKREIIKIVKSVIN